MTTVMINIPSLHLFMADIISDHGHVNCAPLHNLSLSPIFGLVVFNAHARRIRPHSSRCEKEKKRREKRGKMEKREKERKSERKYDEESEKERAKRLLEKTRERASNPLIRPCTAHKKNRSRD